MYEVHRTVAICSVRYVQCLPRGDKKFLQLVSRACSARPVMPRDSRGNFIYDLFYCLKGDSMSKQKFEVGQLVKLKSGGPDMTVSSLHKRFPGDERAAVDCQWFGGKKLERGHFDVDTLVIATASAEVAKK